MNKLLSIAATALLMSCSAPYSHTERGVEVSVTNHREGAPRKVRLEVMKPHIIRVTATPERRFAHTKSLMIQEEALHTVPPTFEVGHHGDTVTLATEKVKAHVLRSTGRVWMTHTDGTPLLAMAEEGMQFAPIKVEGSKGYSTWLHFESPQDEAFYGLGQHQADEWNYKGKNEELFQYNTKVSVPFILSTKGYGLLLDSYSLCRWGRPDDYAQLHQVFTLYDANGQEGALTGTYVSADGKQRIVRREDSLYFADLTTIKNLPEGFPLYGSEVTYEGEMMYTGNDTTPVDIDFQLYYAGYMQVEIDGTIVVPEVWRTAWNPNTRKFTYQLQPGRRARIKISWHPDGGESYCALRAYAPDANNTQSDHRWWSEMTQQLDFYVIASESPDSIISGYRTLTGKAQVMPKWAMGYWQSRERYKTQDELLSTLNEFRQRELPIDNIVLDWSYWREAEWGSHEFDEKRFPTPQMMVDSVHALDARMMISVWPKFYTGTEHFSQFDEQGWIYRQSVTDSLRDWIGRGYHYGFYDAYSEGARKLFWQQMERTLYPLGIDAWWMDASEPNVRDCTPLDYRKALCGPTALGPSTQYFNAYALVNAQGIYEGQRGADPNRRVFLLTRSGFAGLQRYSTATWSGDIATRWEDMKAQISAGLNFAVCGIPYWTMDIGGFCVEHRYEKAFKEYLRQVKKGQATESADLREWRELNTRWHQFGTFCPLYRSHGQYPYREPWHIAPEGHPAYESITYYLRLRYHLMPYIYTLAGMTWHNDYTIMRPLIMDFASQRETHDIGDQYLFGPALMVAPVTEDEAREREVTFPATRGGWYDFYSGIHVSAGDERKMMPAPYERMPLYVKAGSIIPTGPAISSTKAGHPERLTLYVYAGADGTFTLYEDEGTNYNYEQGAYSQIPIHWDDATRTLTLAARKGSFSGMPTTRTIAIVLTDAHHAQPFSPDAAGHTLTYTGEEVSVVL